MREIRTLMAKNILAYEKTFSRYRRFASYSR